jgi:hypothetical protein
MQTLYKQEEPALAEYSQAIDTNIVEYITQTQEPYIKHHRVVDMRHGTTKGEMINSSNLCENLNVFILTHHNKKIPILVMFINAFIHLGMSPHYFKNSILCGQFYQVFAHFAELGERARIYLLKVKCMGRFLDIFMHGEISTPKNPNASLGELYRNQCLGTVPLLQVGKELYLESNLEKNDIFISLNEKKQTQSNATNPHIFLVYTVSILSRSCLFVKSSVANPYAWEGGANFILDREEMGLISNHRHPQWWVPHRLSRNAVATMFAHISFDNKEFSLQMLATVLDGLGNEPFERMKIYERALV